MRDFIKPAIGFLAFALISCTDRDGYKHASGSLTEFVLTQSKKFGATPRSGAQVPVVNAEWRYKADKDGVQLEVAGNRLPELESLLRALFGEPAGQLKTNDIAGHLSVGGHYGPQGGAALSYGWQRSRSGEEVTTLLVVKRSSL